MLRPRGGSPDHPLLEPMSSACLLISFLSYNTSSVGPLGFLVCVGSGAIGLWGLWAVGVQRSPSVQLHALIPFLPGRSFSRDPRQSHSRLVRTRGRPVSSLATKLQLRRRKRNGERSRPDVLDILFVSLEIRFVVFSTCPLAVLY